MACSHKVKFPDVRRQPSHINHDAGVRLEGFVHLRDCAWPGLSFGIDGTGFLFELDEPDAAW